VQRSTIITGVMLSLGAVALAGIAEWASGGFDGLTGDGNGSGVVAEREYAGGKAAGTPVLREGLSSLPTMPAAASPGYTIRRNVPEVRLQFTVADERGKPVQGLSPADIRVLDDRSQVEKFQDFSRDENLPLRLGVLLDASDSVKRVLPEETATAMSFVQQVVRPQSDRAFVMVFGTQSQIWQRSPSIIPNIVDRLVEPSWGTNLYDALYDACSEHLWLHHETDLVHRALVLISDGEDTQSHRALEDVIAIAQRSETQIYALVLRPKKKAGSGDEVMRRLAEATGGRFFVASSSREFQGAFSNIEQELRSQYFVSFRPQEQKPGFHELRVELRAPQKFQIHARQGYYATAN
jgi:VWFA-related protein